MKLSVKYGVGALAVLGVLSAIILVPARPAVSQLVRQGEAYRITTLEGEEEEQLVGIATSAWVKVTSGGREFWINLDRLAESDARDYIDAAYVAEMRSDLLNVAMAEESYFADYVRYVTGLDELGFTTRNDVMLTVDAVDHNGFRATARHAFTPTVCSLWVGTGGDDTVVDRDLRDEGRPVCRDR